MDVRSESIELQWPKHNHDCNQFVAIFFTYGVDKPLLVPHRTKSINYVGHQYHLS